MRLSRPLLVEHLEDRFAPAVFGLPWPDSVHLTLSFAPDGTAIGNQTSSLFSTLNASASPAVWQAEMLRAFQTWAVNANINVGLVGDGGQAFGTTGPVQGDARFGDIRIGATAQPADTVADSMPFDPTAGTWAGDVQLNSNYRFGIGGSGDYDLFTVALHEAGHAFGLPGNADPSSAMYDKFTGARTGLSSSDSAALQVLYGARKPDAIDTQSPNETLDKAWRLNLSDDGSSTFVTGDVTTPSDVDFYHFETDAAPAGITIQLHTAGLSLLVPRLTVMDRSGHVLASTVSAGPLAGDVSLRLDSPKPFTDYYVKVESGTADVFGVGGYQLEIRPDTAKATSSTSQTLINIDNHTNDVIGKATDLRQTIFQTDARFDYAIQASVSDSTDVDFYHFRAPQLVSNSPSVRNVMTVMVWTTQAGGLDPRVTVYNQQGAVVAADVLVNENGTYTVQVANATPNADYYVAVKAAQPTGPHGTGNYFLGIDFTTQAVPMQTFVSGTLTASQTQDFRTLQANESNLFHFVLSATTNGAPVATALRMTIYDASGQVVFTQVVLDGDAVSANVFLAPGTYTFRFAAATRDGSPLPTLAWTL